MTRPSGIWCQRGEIWRSDVWSLGGLTSLHAFGTLALHLHV
jgi:hypothetical protein